MRARFAAVSVFSLAALLAASAAPAAPSAAPGKAGASAALPAKPDPALKALRWREIGPYRGGRVAAVEGVPAQPLTFYFGATGGGVWKTTDGGESWKPVSDGYFGGSVGAVAVAPSDPNVVYVGLGEETIRGNVSSGDGLWKSTDAGATWSRIGLEDSRHVSRIRVDPRNPDLVYVAAMGHAFGPNEMRGVYRSKDGGKTWQRILYANPDAGAVDLVLDPGNPRILYASTWRFRRSPWGFESGGAGSALWKSTDGGDTWKELTAGRPKNGLPKGTLGIIGVTVSPSNPQNVYAIVEADEGGVFRSRDGGLTWTKTSDSRDLRQRAWYYTRIVADPKDEDTVYVLNVRFHKSKDGGRSFATLRVPHGDNHDLWIAPDDPLRMIEGNDGGACVSFDGGRTWTTQANQPTAQIYRVSTDDSFPYRILGAQQDNTALRIRSRGTFGGIGPRDWDMTAGGESGYIVADPRDPDVVFGGSYGGLLVMVNHRTEESRDVNPWPDNPMGWGAGDIKYRFQWNFPLLFSPDDPQTMYAAAQVLFRSRDRGASWEVISPDLTRDDKSKLGPSGGPITKDNTSVEYYATIFAVAESPLEAGVIWAGSDDGLVHVTRDAGKSWKDVTPKGLPEWAMINSIEASPLQKGVAYVAATRYKLDDERPYLYKTADYGASWTAIAGGLPADGFTRVVRADPKRPGLLYAGTERGIWFSRDDGAHWQSLQLELPPVPVTDLTIKDDDLVAATQGRGFWVLGDLSVLRQIESGAAKGEVTLYEPAPVWRVESGGGFFTPQNVGTNPPNGVVVYYALDGVKEGTPLQLEFLDAQGKLLRTFKGEAGKEEPKSEARPAGEVPAAPEIAKASAPEEKAAAKEAKDEKAAKAHAAPGGPGGRRGHEEPKVDGTPGLNRFVWDLRTESAKTFEGLVLWAAAEGAVEGPRVVPGTYQARLTVGSGDGKQAQTVSFAVKADPRSSASQADLEAQYAFLTAIRDELSQVHHEIGRVREVRTGLRELETRAGEGDAGKPVREAARALDKKMTAVEEALYQTKNRSSQDPLNFPIRLNDKLALLARSAGEGDFAPTAQAKAVKQELDASIEVELGKLRELWQKDLPALNQLARDQSVPAVSSATKDKED